MLLLIVLGLILWNIVQSIRISNLEKKYDSVGRKIFDINKYLMRNGE
jgi:hypothetical protein